MMALDRFLAVCYPVNSKSLRSPANTTIALSIVYAIILISQIPVAEIYDVYVYDFIMETRSTCVIVRIVNGEATSTEVRITIPITKSSVVKGLKHI